MKKLLLSTLALCGLLLSSQAQITKAIGSTAPDFTVTDTDGKTWNLYDILDQGKTVIIKLSYAGCAACKWYHDNHFLDNYWSEYGPSGTDQLVVLLINNQGSTFSGWSAANHPVVEGSQGSTVASAYGVVASPAIAVICPDRTIAENNGYQKIQSNSSMLNYITNCGSTGGGGGGGGGGDDAPSIDMSLVNSAYGGLKTVCPGDDVSFWTWVSAGTKPSSYKLSAKEGNSVLTEMDVTPSANWNNGEWASPGTVTVNANKNITMEVTYENDPTPGNNSVNQQISVVSVPTTDVIISVTTNDDPTNVEFGLFNKGEDTNGDGTLASSSFAGGDANKTQDFPVSLQNGNCYSWKMFINQASSAGVKMEIKDANENVIYTMDGDAEPTFWGVGNFQVSTSSAIEEISNALDLKVTPNPVVDQAVLSMDLKEGSAVSYAIRDLTGKLVQEENLGQLNAGNQQVQLDLAKLPNGLYTLTTTVDGVNHQEKIEVLH